MTDKDSAAASEPLASPGGFKRSFDVAFLTGSTEDKKPNNTTGTYSTLGAEYTAILGLFYPLPPLTAK